MFASEFPVEVHRIPLSLPYYGRKLFRSTGPVWAATGSMNRTHPGRGQQRNSKPSSNAKNTLRSYHVSQVRLCLSVGWISFLLFEQRHLAKFVRVVSFGVPVQCQLSGGIHHEILHCKRFLGTTQQTVFNQNDFGLR